MTEQREEKQTIEAEDLTMDHEALAGEEISDPWADDEQTDWPNEEAVSNYGVGADQGTDNVA